MTVFYTYRSKDTTKSIKVLKKKRYKGKRRKSYSYRSQSHGNNKFSEYNKQPHHSIQQNSTTTLPKLLQSDIENCCCCARKSFMRLLRSSMPSWKRTLNFSWTKELWLSTLRLRSSLAWRPDTSDVDESAVLNNWPYKIHNSIHWHVNDGKLKHQSSDKNFRIHQINQTQWPVRLFDTLQSW